MMDRLGADCPVALAVSLHASNDALRDNLVPLNLKYPIAELMDACLRYLEHAPRDFITFEYCMLDGVNDQPEHARELARLVPGRRRILSAVPAHHIYGFLFSVLLPQDLGLSADAVIDFVK